MIINPLEKMICMSGELWLWKMRTTFAWIENRTKGKRAESSLKRLSQRLFELNTVSHVAKRKIFITQKRVCGSVFPLFSGLFDIILRNWIFLVGILIAIFHIFMLEFREGPLIICNKWVVAWLLFQRLTFPPFWYIIMKTRSQIGKIIGKFQSRELNEVE
jgi:hypothetical protein